jgi:hypothetical protein
MAIANRGADGQSRQADLRGEPREHTTSPIGYPHLIVQAVAIFMIAGVLLSCFNFMVFPQSGNELKFLR